MSQAQRLREVEELALSQLSAMCRGEGMVSDDDRIHACGALLGHVGTVHYWEQMEREDAKMKETVEP